IRRLRQRRHLFRGLTPPLPPTFYITTTSLPSATVGTPYSEQLQATGGATPYKWKKVAGSLPKGLKLNHRGLLSGTASAKDAPGTFTFAVQVTTDDTQVRGQPADQHHPGTDTCPHAAGPYRGDGNMHFQFEYHGERELECRTSGHHLYG
ncbi:MAG TPA: Ig domain-containing protein, partial [Acidimicrobiales bacterium]|nr:Ig domain-containing protein [Acidimicrobiales bacterium]